MIYWDDTFGTGLTRAQAETLSFEIGESYWVAWDDSMLSNGDSWSAYANSVDAKGSLDAYWTTYDSSPTPVQDAYILAGTESGGGELVANWNIGNFTNRCIYDIGYGNMILVDVYSRGCPPYLSIDSPLLQGGTLLNSNRP